jgi:hypothetical protein
MWLEHMELSFVPENMHPDYQQDCPSDVAGAKCVLNAELEVVSLALDTGSGRVAADLGPKSAVH